MSGKAERGWNAALLALWVIAIGGALAFAAIKLRNWGSALDAPEQSDFASYYDAAHISQRAPERLYRSGEWSEVVGTTGQKPLPFLYMPATAVIIQPISTLPYDTARRLWFWASVLSIAGAVGLIAWKTWSNDSRVVSLLLLLLSPATLDTLHLGQINGFLALLVTLAWVGYDHTRPLVRFWAGLLLGVACCIKPVPVGLALLALLDRRVTYLAGFMSGAIGFFLVGLIALPVGVTQAYIETMRQMAGELAPPGLTIFWNQSLPAFWQKSLGGIAPAWVPLLTLLSVGGVLFLAARTVRNHRRVRAQSTTVEVAVVFLAMLLCAPITWWHYLLIVAPLYVGLADAYFSPRPHLVWKMALPVGYALTVMQRGAERLVVATGIPLFSSLMMVGLLIWLLMLERKHA